MINTIEQAKEFLEELKWKVCKVRNGSGWFNIYLNGRLYQTEDTQGLIFFAREEKEIIEEVNKEYAY